MTVLHRQDRAVRAAAKRWRASTRAEANYTREVLEIMGGAHRGILQVVERELLAPKDTHVDARSDDPVGLGPGLMRRIATWMRPRVEDAFGRMSRDVASATQRAAQLAGIHVGHVAGVDSAVEHAKEANVALITGATQDFLDQVRDVLDETDGQTTEEIREALQGRVDVSRSRGALIARDQTLKLNSQVTQHRQRAAGVAKYTWSGSLDERERPMHRDLEGQVISWDDPPETNEDGDRNHPGEDYQCRCVAVPALDEASDDEEEGDDEAEAAE